MYIDKLNPVIGYHWLPQNKRLAHEDGREVIIGETLEVRIGEEGGIEVCERGLHAGDTPYVAYHSRWNSECIYWLCKVELWGHADEHTEIQYGLQIHKVAAQYRRVLSMVNGYTVAQKWLDHLRRYYPQDDTQEARAKLDAASGDMARYLALWMDGRLRIWHESRAFGNMRVIKAYDRIAIRLLNDEH